MKLIVEYSKYGKQISNRLFLLQLYNFPSVKGINIVSMRLSYPKKANGDQDRHTLLK